MDRQIERRIYLLYKYYCPTPENQQGYGWHPPGGGLGIYSFINPALKDGAMFGDPYQTNIKLD
ncbi:MAG: hypothetical protein HUJ22_06545 [Gracilimonas sp.]|uniref:hypothetical protein n=1 Tax=Gracilimonas sp. TaxID=1974203 RepID=UPI0019CC6593|nr:hypothetical protein [Gracilimonas sp.]MBD3616218.1 hypothetical protein [Gracilimonas sp.]